MFKLLIVLLYLFTHNYFYCSEFKDYIELNFTSSSSDKNTKHDKPKKTKICCDNDWYILSAMMLSGASSIMGTIVTVPCLVFEDYTTAALYTGITGASIAVIWTVPQMFYWGYKGYRSILRKCNYEKTNKGLV